MLNIFTHLYELKIKVMYIWLSLICTFLSSYLFAPQIINILTEPLTYFLDQDNSNFIFTNIFEVFNTYIIIAVYSCLFFNTPISLYLIFSFLKPGLFSYEKKILHTCFTLILCNLILSSFFSFFVIFPSILSFFLSLDLITNTQSIILKIQPKLFDYIYIVCQFLFIYGFLIFQIPGFIYIFIYLSKPEGSLFYNKRRFFILLFLTIGCIFSSPDITCLIIISLPLVLFFEFAVFLAILKNKYKRF